MSMQDLLAVEITPARMDLVKEPQLALSPSEWGLTGRTGQSRNTAPLHF